MITIGNEPKRIGLALSGGGYRATAFHLGVFRTLSRLNLLKHVDLLSGVSGGSIAAAWYALHHQEGGDLDGLQEFLSTRSIAVRAFLLGMIDPAESRVDKLADAYDRHLFKGRCLRDLHDGPRLYINATNLGTGNLFSFITGGKDDKELEDNKVVMTDHELEVVDAGSFSLARAVAASSAFPPVFAPMKLDQSEFPSTDMEHIMLTDGGVYDNLGVNPLVRERNKLDYLIVSDAGKPFESDPAHGGTGAGVLGAMIGLLMEQVRGLQFAKLRAAQTQKSLWFSIDSNNISSGSDERKAQVSNDAVNASNISTHLKKLSEVELSLLARHADTLLTDRLETYAPELRDAAKAAAD